MSLQEGLELISTHGYSVIISWDSRYCHVKGQQSLIAGQIEWDFSDSDSYETVEITHPAGFSYIDTTLQEK